MPGAGGRAPLGAIYSQMGWVKLRGTTQMAYGFSPGQFTLLPNCLPSTLKRGGPLRLLNFGFPKVGSDEGKGLVFKVQH